jgi:hypothetical protein
MLGSRGVIAMHQLRAPYLALTSSSSRRMSAIVASIFANRSVTAMSSAAMTPFGLAPHVTSVEQPQSVQLPINLGLPCRMLKPSSSLR